MTNTGTFTIYVPHTFAFGWGVYFPLTYDENDTVTEIRVSIVFISSDSVDIIDSEPCVGGVLVKNFLRDPAPVNEDTYDFRSRWFASAGEARDHAEEILRQWKHSKQERSFIQTDANWRYV